MSQGNQIQLKPLSILQVPLYSYQKDFTFIVNGEEFKTSRIFSDLISSKIKVFEQLGIKSIEFTSFNQPTEITKDNVFTQLQTHEKYHSFHSKFIKAEIDFISSHFYELCEDQKDNICKLDQTTIEQIINNDHLHLTDEDQLLSFINYIYLLNHDFSIFYKYVDFSNVSTSTIGEFLDIFNFDDLRNEVWIAIEQRHRQEIKSKDMRSPTSDRYENQKKNSSKSFKKSGNGSQFDGIINFLKTKSNGNIENEIAITASSTRNDSFLPIFSISYDDPNKRFISETQSNSWLCFDFKQHRVTVTDYTIRTDNIVGCKPKSWVIEGSENYRSWDTIDTQNNCPILNEVNKTHTFTVSNQNNKKYRYIRMRLTSRNWGDCDCLRLNSFEIYGDLN